MRAQEVGDLHWSEVDLDEGEICLLKHRTKNKLLSRLYGFRHW
jgi:hypothetical protein